MSGTPSKTAPAKPGGIGDDAVKAATGKTWSQWLKSLDAAGAKGKSHKEIVAIVAGAFDIGPWWQQMVTVGYEQARGLRKKHERPDGFSVSGSKTVSVPVATLFQAWNDSRKRKTWLGDHAIRVRTATAPKSMRITWSDKASTLTVNFYAKGADKSQVALDHMKLPDEKQAAKFKKFWSQRLDQLKSALEG